MSALVFAVVALAVSPPAQALPLPAAEAAQFVGKTGSFEGLVAAVRGGPRGAVLLELDAKAPHASLTVMVPAQIAGAIAGIKQWSGKRVVVTGLVQRIDGRLQITVERPANLSVAAQPDRIPCDAPGQG